MLKEEIFKDGLNFIKDQSIRDFTIFVLNKLPEYFWTIKASTSGLHHGGETQIEHVLGCVELGFAVCEQQMKWSQVHRDMLISSLLLHDGWKCGEGKILFTEEDFLNNKCKEDCIGAPKITRDHPFIGYTEVTKLFSEFKLKPSIGKTIAKSIRFHMGPWTNEDEKLPMSSPYDSVVVQTHNIDFFQSRMAKLKEKK